MSLAFGVDNAPAGAVRRSDDGQLTPSEVESITGIEPERPVAQRNRLRKLGIKAEINARREVVCFWSWVAAAALPAAAFERYLPPVPQEEDDIGMNLGALHG